MVTFYIQVMQMILHVRVRVRRVFPGRLGRFKVLVHLLHTGGVLIPTYDGNTLTSYYRMVL